MNAPTEDQLNAILDAKDSREDLAAKPSEEVAKILAAEGHPAWKKAAPAKPATTATATIEKPAAPRGAGLNLPPPRTMPGAARAAPEKPAAPPPEPAKPSPAPALPAPAPRHLPTKAMPAPEGAGRLTQEDIKIPRLAIAQNTSTGDKASPVPPGRWFLSSDPEGATEGRVIQVLEIEKWRELMFPYQDARAEQALRDTLRDKHGVTVPEDRKFACRSLDREVPTDHGWGVVSSSCDACPFARWEVIGGKRTPPQCSELYRVLVMDVDTSLPAFYRVRGTAIAHMKNLNTLLMVAARGRHPLFLGELAPFSAFRVKLGAKETSSGKNKWWVPVFGRPEPITEKDEIEIARALRAAIVESGANVIEDEGEVADAAGEAA